MQSSFLSPRYASADHHPAPRRRAAACRRRGFWVCGQTPPPPRSAPFDPRRYARLRRMGGGESTVRRRLPIGIQNFGEMRGEGHYYADKTPHIERLIEDGKALFPVAAAAVWQEFAARYDQGAVRGFAEAVPRPAYPRSLGLGAAASGAAAELRLGGFQFAGAVGACGGGAARRPRTEPWCGAAKRPSPRNDCGASFKNCTVGVANVWWC